MSFGFGYGFGIATGSPRGYDEDAVAWFDRMGTQPSSQHKQWLSNMVRRIKSDGNWTKLDWLKIYALTDKADALLNALSASYTATEEGTVSGRFTTMVGFDGNGTDYNLNHNFNPGDGGTYKYLLDSAALGFYGLDNVAETKIEMSNLDSGGNGTDFGLYTAGFVTNIRQNALTSMTGYNDISSKGFKSINRTASAVQNLLGSGMPVKAGTATSTTVGNINLLEFCRIIGAAKSLRSTRQHAFAFAGGGDIDAFKLQRAILEEYILKINVVFKKRVIFHGNSLLNNSGIGRRCLSTLTDFCGERIELLTSNRLTTDMTTEAPTKIDPYVWSSLTKDILIGWEGTNDLYYGASATTAYNNLVTYYTARRAAGFKVIVTTLLPRSNAGTPGSFEADRQTVNTNLRNNWASFGDALADVGADANMGDAGDELDLTYYDADKVHPNQTGNDYLADNYFIPAIQSI